MEHPSHVDEDGYTKLNFHSQGATRRPVGPEKGVIPSICPHWIVHEKSCYLFSLSLDSWCERKKRCSQLGSCLLKIDTLKEFNFIEGQMSSYPINSFQIGPSPNQTEKLCLWDNGSTFFYNLFQIRSTATQENTTHNCAWIHMGNAYDQPCNIPSFLTCKKLLSGGWDGAEKYLRS
ncbi:C-type lectin domain family 7 member A-like [Fukomys damarensis]|uniref:C-type lectin domain family 7 member A-like n=1 Tax=Fukomys damarensis TaxID=885580 RepID=UPI00053FEA50|nr:C-type lectin domain family 7 member A-like [Fukomys damarensis]